MPHPSPIQLILVDQYMIIRRGIAVMLTPYADLKVLKEASDGEEAVRLCTQYHPDVILMEINLPQMNGLAATRLIRTRYPATQVLIFTDTVNSTLVRDAFSAGAIGYLLKNASPDELCKAIRSVYAGRITVAYEATQCLIQATTMRQQPAVGSDLTLREREVLDLMVTGMTNGTIAQTLTVSQSTIKFHVSNILAKLHTKARTEAIGVALRHHLVHP
jgi:NarL family two-component system response regulator LiaR